ncbi:MAG: bifunctional proline dehydrogenase/L-glutamate gamma-semialdehyde dehydrogenase [Aquiluna sp.]
MALKTTQIPTISGKPELVEASITLVDKWVSEAAQLKENKSSQRLSGLLKDPNGLDFAVGFIDGVIRPEDIRVAATNLYQLRTLTPRFLPWPLRALLGLGANLAPLLPWPVIPIARSVLRSFVSHLVIDASQSKFRRATRKLGLDATLNVNLLGEAVLGHAEADKRLSHVAEILSRPETEYVSVKVSAIVAPHSPWAFDQTVQEVIERLTPLYKIAADSPKKKFINLDMEEYRDLDMTIAVFKGLLAKPEFKELSAGIVLQAYLPDALRVMIDLQQWAALRVIDGGAPIKVRVVKGANLPMERVDAEMHDWPLATVPSKAEADANYKRVLNYALTPERVKNVKIGVAGHNLFDLAFAWLLASQRSAQDGMDVEMLLGMAPNQASVISKSVGKLVLYTPVVYSQEFDVAIAYLIRRLEEGASSENFLSNAFELTSQQPYELERQRYMHSLDLMGTEVPVPNRLQDRSLDEAHLPVGFSNTPDTDPSTAGNRNWAKGIYRRLSDTEIGIDLVERHTVTSEVKLNELIVSAKAAQKRWQTLNPEERASKIHEVGVVLERNREYLVEVAMAEAGKTLDQVDTEISEAIDFAHYYAEQSLRLENLPGTKPVPRKITVVTPPWNFPIAIPAGGALAALAAGSAVIFKPAGPAARCGAVLAELILEVIDPELFVPIHIGERELGQRLIGHEDVDQVILTGGYETAELFRSFRPDLKLLAETSGKNAIIVTPHADLDLAAKDIAYSAFGHAGQKCSASSIVILVGSVAKSKRFRRQLMDAVSSLKVAHPTDPTAQMGPMIAPPEGKLLTGLTALERGEKWLMKPEQLDETGKLWSPGVIEHVRPGSRSHLVEYFGPVLAIMTAPNLNAAIALQNSVDYGLTAGIHSLNSQEITDWLARVQAGNVYVNRGITGAIVQRQPFGGWKKSAVGPGAKAGGPNYLFGLTDWVTEENGALEPVETKEMNALLAQAAMSELSDDQVASLIRCAQSDLAALRHYFSGVKDETGLEAEWNYLRYFRSDCTIRVQAGASDYETWRVLVTATALGNIEISAESLPSNLMGMLGRVGIQTKLESEESWLESLKLQPRRVRVVGELSEITVDSPLASVDVAIYDGPVTESGIIEGLAFFKEQAVSVTTHRFGNPARHVQMVRL